MAPSTRRSSVTPPPLQHVLRESRAALRRKLRGGIGWPALEVRASALGGRGLFAREHVAAGTAVIEYTGERITRAEAERRDAAAAADAPSYTFHVDRQLCIDAEHVDAALARFVNHSRRAPNCFARVCRAERGTEKRLLFVAGRDLAPGTELLIDYGDRRGDVLAANPWLR